MYRATCGLVWPLGVSPEEVVEVVGGCLSADALVSAAMVVMPEPSVKGGRASLASKEGRMNYLNNLLVNYT